MKFRKLAITSMIGASLLMLASCSAEKSGKLVEAEVEPTDITTINVDMSDIDTSSAVSEETTKETVEETTVVTTVETVEAVEETTIETETTENNTPAVNFERLTSSIVDGDYEDIDFEDIEFVEGVAAKTKYVFDLKYDNKTNKLVGNMKATIQNCTGETWSSLEFQDWATNDYYVQRYSQIPTEFSNVKATFDGEEYELDLVRGKDKSVMHTDLPFEINDGDIVTFETDFIVNVPVCEERLSYSIKDGKEICMLGNCLPVLALYKDGGWVTHPYINMGESFTSETAYYDVTFKAPENFAVTMTGKPIANGDTYHSVQNKVRDFAIILGKGYDVYEEEYNGITISVFDKSENSKNFPNVVKDTAAVIDYYEAWIGPYPYDSLDVCYLNLAAASGMEYPALITDTEYLPNDPTVLSHEIGHEWFYLIVGNDEYEEPWLDESFASFLSNEYLIDNNYFTEDMLYVDKAYMEYYEGMDTGMHTSDDDFIYVFSIYYFGATFIKDVRDTMGPEDFEAAIREIYDTYYLLQADTEGVFDIFRSHTDADIDSLIEVYFPNRNTAE